MNPSSIVEAAHCSIKEIHNKKVAIDATCGNGHDSVFLAIQFTKVYSIDIQELAIKRSKVRLQDFPNVEIIQADFNDLSLYVKEKVDCIIFNLGFLPGSNKKILTQDYHSEEAIIKAYDLLAIHGTLLICCYIQHPGGKEEFKRIIENIKHHQLPYQLTTFNDTPDLLIIIKRLV